MKNSLTVKAIETLFCINPASADGSQPQWALTHLNGANYVDILIHQRMSRLLSEPLMTLKQGMCGTPNCVQSASIGI